MYEFYTNIYTKSQVNPKAGKCIQTGIAIRRLGADKIQILKLGRRTKCV